MLAFLLCLGLLASWTVVGYSVLRVLDFTRGRLQSLLLAPPVGVVATVLPVFVVNRMGVPCKTLAWPVAAALLLVVVAGIVLDRRRDRAAWVTSTGTLLLKYAPFAAIVVIALAISGRPMFEFGFDWLSYCNDDMANYTLAAQRFLHHGFFDLPPVDTIALGTEQSQNFWFMHARDGQRPGCELLIAWVAGLTGLSVHDVFMPTIVAMHGGLVSAAAGAVLRFRRRYGIAIATVILMATSALTTFGAMYQLIAQVAGLGTLAVATAVTLRPLHTMRWNVAWRYGLMLGVLAAGFLVIYPEATPFLGISFVLYHAFQLVRRRGRAPWKRLAVVAGVTTVAAVALMGLHTINAFIFLLDQRNVANTDVDVQIKLFPFYLLPSGLGNLWNLQRIASLPLEPWMSLTIVAGAALSVWVLVAAARQSWRGEPIAVMTLFMFLISLQLFTGSQAFGLYKIAMFLQPFMLGVLAISLWRLLRWAPLRWAPVLLLAGGSAYTQHSYVQESRGAGTFAEIRDASEMGLTTVLRDVIGDAKPGSVVLDTTNLSLVKIQSAYTRGIETSFPTHNFFQNIRRVNLPNRNRSAEVAAWSRHILTSLLSREFVGEIDFKNDRGRVEPFQYNTLGMKGGTPSNSQYLLATGGNLTVLNRTHYPPDKGRPFVMRPMADVRNHLTFKFSEFGLPYFGGLKNDDNVSFFQVENDPMIDGGRFAAIGRYMLFEVLNPTDDARFVLEMTSTVKADHRNRLPAATIVGQTRQPLPLIGRGAARVFSAPVKPQVIGGRPYVLLDMGEFGTFFPFYRTGLMKLWGGRVLYDGRKVVAFARDISMVSGDEYAALAPPAALARFPQDLLDPQLEYSGIYEKDGWVSDASYYMLDPAGANAVSVRGQVPFVADEAFQTTATLLVDGNAIATKRLSLGTFELTGPIPPTAVTGRHRVELRFDRTQSLPDPDNRPVSAQLTFVGFEKR